NIFLSSCSFPVSDGSGPASFSRFFVCFEGLKAPVKNTRAVTARDGHAFGGLGSRRPGTFVIGLGQPVADAQFRHQDARAIGTRLYLLPQLAHENAQI